MVHIPVLQKEILENLNPLPNDNFIDCTVNGGGHASLMLERIAPKGKLLGIDWNTETIENCKINTEKYKDRIILACDNFVNIDKVVEERGFKNVKGILFDLGMSSWQLDDSKKGLSFQKNESLDMRLDSEAKISAKEIVNSYSETDLAKIISEYGQERFASKIAREIAKERQKKQISSTFELVSIIKEAVPRSYQNQKIHFATRTFQAIRIATNDELNSLKNALPKALRILERDGKLAVISFHSLEDRIIKDFFRDSVKNNLITLFNKKPIQPSFDEISMNRRSRSAKLRIAIKQ